MTGPPADSTVQRARMFADKIRGVPDFPKPGILFRDITTLLQDGPLFRSAVDAFADDARRRGAEAIVGIESRGFIFGAAAAAQLGLPFVPARKPGKLPSATVREEYTLEYGTDAIEMHADALAKGRRVVIADDLLATGGTAAATVRLVEALEAEVVGLTFLVELSFLCGRDRLAGYPLTAFVDYAGE